MRGLELNLTVTRVCVSSLVILVFNNEGKFYSYSFVLVPELLKEHSPLSTLFEMLFTDWRMNLETHSKDLRSKNISLRSFRFS